MSTRIAELQDADLSTYSIHDLHAAGLRFVHDYDQADALDQYLELHPGADRAAVKQELSDQIKRRESSAVGA